MGVIIGLFAMARYNREVSTIPPERLLAEQPLHTVRVLGLVEAGSLVKGASGEPLHFMLSGGRAQVPVQYRGDDPENLRELKWLVIVGRWDPERRELEAEAISLVPNYGFVTSAYLVTLISLVLFLFHMERRVALLYIMIKGEKAYQPEEGT